MVNYLFGDLPEEAQIRLEERFFTDDEYYRQLVALEDELRYDYVAGGLSPQQRAKYERRFLTSPQARDKAELARIVLDKAAQVRTGSAPEQSPVVNERKSFWQSLSALFGFQHPAMQLSLAAASVLLLAGVSWLFYQTARLRSQVRELEVARAGQEHQRAQREAEEQRRREQLAEQLDGERRKRAQLEDELSGLQAQAARTRQPSPAAFLSFILAPGLVRDADGPKRLIVPAGADSLRLQLDLKRPDNYRSYRVGLQTLDGVELLIRDLPRSRSAAAGRAVTLSLPARFVPPGDYVLALKGKTGSGELEEMDEYYFTVVRR